VCFNAIRLPDACDCNLSVEKNVWLLALSNLTDDKRALVISLMSKSQSQSRLRASRIVKFYNQYSFLILDPAPLRPPNEELANQHGSSSPLQQQLATESAHTLVAALPPHTMALLPLRRTTLHHVQHKIDRETAMGT
jgi:hypothetical protein